MNKQEQQQATQMRLAMAQQKVYVDAMRKDSEMVKVKAEYWKAQVEVMKYSMEYEELQPAYEAHLERMKAKDADLQAKKEAAIQELHDNLAKDHPGVEDIKEPVAESSGREILHTLDVSDDRLM